MNVSPYLRALARSKLLQDTSLVFISNFGSAITLFISSVILARFWGVAAFGSITSLFGIASLATGLTDFGINIAAIRLVSQYRTSDASRYHFLLLAILASEAALGGLIVMVALLGAPWIAEQLLHSPAETGAVRWMLLGAGFWSALSYVTVTLQAHRRFGLWAMIAILGNGLRTIGTVTASYLARSIEMVAAAYCLATLVTLLVGIAIVLPRYPPFVGLATPLKQHATRLFFQFAKWVAVTATLNTLLMRTDVILLSALAASVQVGLYGVAFQLSIGASIAINSFNTVLLPRASAIHTGSDVRRYVQQALTLSAIVGGGIVVMFLVAEPLVRLLYGALYLDAVPILRIMLAAYLVYTFTYPFVLLTYRLDRPDISSKVNLLKLVLLVLGDIVMIPQFGAIAPAIMLFVLTLVGQTIILVWLATRGRQRAKQLNLGLKDA